MWPLHLANHSLGLVSMAVAERGLAFTLGLWQQHLPAASSCTAPRLDRPRRRHAPGLGSNSISRRSTLGSSGRCGRRTDKAASWRCWFRAGCTACLGIHLAFAKRPLYRRLRWALFAAALLLPVLGGLEFLAMGHELAAEPSQRARSRRRHRMADDRTAWLLGVKEALLAVYFGAIAAVFSARAIRAVCGPQGCDQPTQAQRRRSDADTYSRDGNSH
jgi:hypothetical protein